MVGSPRGGYYFNKRYVVGRVDLRREGGERERGKGEEREGGERETEGK